MLVINNITASITKITLIIIFIITINVLDVGNVCYFDVYYDYYCHNNNYYHCSCQNMLVIL